MISLGRFGYVMYHTGQRDPRITSPLDDTILESVERTERLIVVDEATPRCGMATDFAAQVAEKRLDRLRRRSGV